MGVAVNISPKYRVTPPFLKKSSSRLLYIIFNELGGISKVGREIGEHRQTIWGWIKRGKVPLIKVEKVSKILKINPIAFNAVYTKYVLCNAMEWEDVVCAIVQDARTQSWILSGQRPK